MTLRRSATLRVVRRDAVAPAFASSGAAKERIRFLAPDGLAGGELCIGENVVATGRAQLNEDPELRLITRGRVAVACNGETRALGEGAVAWIPAYALHAWMPADNGPFSFLALQLSHAEFERAGGAPALDGASLYDSVELVTVDRMPVAAVESPDTIERAVDAVLACIVSLQPRARSRSASSVPSIDRAVGHLRHHCARKVCLDELAFAARLSKFHFVRLFAATLGTTPHRYQMLARVAQARSLLRSGLPIAEVASHTGFSDQSHFTRWFHDIVGVTPGRYLLDMAPHASTRH
jgi:AraC-like DNA-binding protein